MFRAQKRTSLWLQDVACASGGTLKFDYRNKDKPWGNSQDAVERAINKLRGKCVGDG